MTYERCASDRVMRWRLLVEEFSPEFRYIKGKHNLIADDLSRLEMEPPEPQEKHTVQCMASIMTRSECILDDLTILEVAENFGETSKERTDDSHGYVSIFIQTAVWKDAMDWYHEYICHPGYTRT
jgi:hypothetical protein